ncbi:UDP-N-acetyl-D-mannosamine dehydrogenase [Bosea robiniae]|uniref:UDP-N-acetyl-D-mannosaminuronic acid dehydrogenase n=1 Tax=Bosea robiniae TaxID=1036780 RepID=A0ABY0P1E6_9HYPH|nr:UDP-N-acetyl-D-mannosamine dehydrogenase [Bosea robiniae]SDG73016.1 UDP-N-acetyl-D-mannosaminuronic acid dehydrogenase [Bosea robiniae]
MSQKKICVVGLGYIGLPTAAMFASRGHEVVGVDINPDVVESLNAGRAHFEEPDLGMLMAAAAQTGRFRATLGAQESADVYILAVPTPFKDGNKPDMSYVDAATDSIIPLLKADDIVILESTSPVGTTERICDRICAARADLRTPRFKEAGSPGQLRIAHCPERILPGQMIRELVANDRVVGGISEMCADAARSVYDSFVKGQTFLTDSRTAEFVKLIENSYRDVNIAFANEMSMICDHLDLDVWEAINLANKHPRVSILRPGPGVGGHCIAVDPWFVIDSAPEQSRVIRQSREVNLEKTRYVTEKIEKAASRFRDPVIACLGVTYKNDVEDLRESPALEIIGHLAANSQQKILVCDPMVKVLPSSLADHANVSLVDLDTARAEADIIVCLVGHRAFQRLDPKLFFNKVVIDTIGLMYDRA